MNTQNDMTDAVNAGGAEGGATKDEKSLPKMELTIFRQGSTLRENGENSYTVYKGEDARPYIDKDIFFVADGLGGTGGIRHQEFDKHMFDPEKLPYIVLDGIEGDEYADIRKYILDSFSEFLAIKDVYFDKIHNIKKGGYFGSRVASAVLLKLMRDNASRFADGKIFEEILGAESLEDKLAELGDFFTDAIERGIKESAKRCNLFYESRMSGLLLLATTLTATIYHEGEDYVDTLTLNAGDSRPYLWNPTGLYQTMEDQEGADGGMTNCISANAAFRIVPSYRRVKKPCILFNTSDGCFDSIKFYNSQLAFEKLLLESFVQNDTLKGARDALYGFFLENGTHDDSSTIAMKIFGIESYEALQDMARTRLAELEDKYLSPMPELLTVSYKAQVDRAVRASSSKYELAKAKLVGLDEISLFCKERAQSGEWEPYNTALATLNAELSNLGKERENLEGKLRAVIEKHAVLMASAMELDRECGVSKAEKERAERFIADINAFADKFKERVGALGADVSEKLGALADMLKHVSALDNPLSCIGDSHINILYVNQAAEMAHDVYSKISVMLRNLAEGDDKEYSLPYLQKIREYADFNRTAVNEGAVDILLSAAVSGEGKLEAECSAFAGDKELLADLAPSLKDIYGRSERAKAELSEKMAKEYFDTSYKSIIDSILAGKAPYIGDEKRDELAAIFDVDRELSELAGKAARQRELLDAYDAVYYSLIKG